MDVRSQYASRYKKDLSIDNLRAKVARRKSITQKENRHKEFRKSRGLSLADVNVSFVKEKELSVVEEMNESGHVKGHENKPANQGRTKEQIVKEERHAMLQRFKEDKQLRKLKDQREKASKGIFRCGIYKPETSFIPVLTTQTAAKVKPKPLAPSVTSIVTRSIAKTEPPASKIRTQAILVNVLSNKAPVDRAIPKSRGQTTVVKTNESKVSAIPSMKMTRSAARAKLQTDKIPQKKTAATKSQKKTTKVISPEMVVAKTESPVTDQSNDKVQEPEPNLKDTSVEKETVLETLLDVHIRKPSFAPQNFVFQPLDGLSTLKFQPMTHNRANAFLTPTFTWSPLDDKRKYVENNTEDHKIDLVSPTEPSLTTTEVKPELDLHVSPQDKECASDVHSAPQSSPAVTSLPCEPSAELLKSTEKQSVHDVLYFRGNLKSEIQKLTLLCSDWDKRIDLDIPEDAKDLIRTTVGQTRLLMTERFKQFEGLVNNCEFKQGEKETTCTDLDGFWDMIYFQIEDVSKKFVNLVKLEENSWQQNTVQTKKVVRKKTASVTTVKQNQGEDGRAAARSRLAAIKAAMKNKVKIKEPSAEVEAPILSMQVDPVVFDAGFFRIESPAKLPGSLRITTNTPKSTKKIVQNSATSITDGEGLKPETCPSPVKSLVRKSLFDIPEESLQNQETGRIMQYPPHTEADSAPAVADLTKYLVRAQPMSLAAEESPGLMKCLGLATSETQDRCDTDGDIETSGTDDVFMCSPGPIVHTTAACPLPSQLGSDEDVKTTSNPLDFLGSCTPIMVKHSPMRVEPGTALTDLIVFSPMDE